MDGRRRPRAPPVEPRQGVLARRGLHQRRPARLLLQRRRADPAPPARASAHDEAHAGRHLGAVLLREDGAVPHTRLDPPLSGPQRREQGRRHRVPDGERPRHAAVRRQPRLHRDAPAALALLHDRDARLPLLRPRPHGCELRGCPHRRASRPSGARSAGADGLPEDVRRDRRADLRARRTRLVLRPGARLRGHARPDDRTRRSRARDDGVADRQAHRQGLHRPQHEPQRSQHLRGVLAPPRSRRHGLHSAPVGGGRRRRDAAGLPHRQRLGAVREAGRPVRGRPDLAAGARYGARGGRPVPREGRETPGVDPAHVGAR